MANMMQQRLANALEARQLSQNEVSRRIGGSMGLVRDILSGKSQAPTITTVRSIADALNVSTAYLIGEIDTYFPVAGTQSRIAEAEIIGRCAVGVWQDLGAPQPSGRIEFVADSRFPQADYFAYAVDGDSATLVAPSGSHAICVKVQEFGREIRENMVVVARRVLKEGLAETSIRTVVRTPRGMQLVCPSPNPSHGVIELSSEGVAVLHVVIQAVNVVRF
jgi:transcriptional regulator with XRE-family HTH domain